MPDDLATALTALRPLLLDTGLLVRAVAAGRRRSAVPAYQRAELRPVDLKAGRHLQVVTTDGHTPLTRNYLPDRAGTVVDDLLAEPFGNWHVETRDEVIQLRVTKKGRAQVHRSRPSRRAVIPTGHDRVRRHLLDPGDPLFDALGADADKRRQVEAFLRALAPAVPRLRDRVRDRDRDRDRDLDRDRAGGHGGSGGELRVVDLGCGNAYLTFAAHRWLSGPDGVGVPVRTVGVDVRPGTAERNAELAARLGMDGLTFTARTIAGTDGAGVDLALALHACDTATDDALAVAAHHRVPVVLAAPCCHHDLQRQLADRQRDGDHGPASGWPLLRHGILRERFADVLTDTLRAELLRLLGYRVEVIEFVDSRHTPRNTLLRAYRTDAPPDQDRVAGYRDLVTDWGVTPALARLLADDLAGVLPT
jgi:SAM-dependent methyltransferase